MKRNEKCLYNEVRLGFQIPLYNLTSTDRTLNFAVTFCKHCERYFVRGKMSLPFKKSYKLQNYNQVPRRALVTLYSCTRGLLRSHVIQQICRLVVRFVIVFFFRCNGAVHLLIGIAEAARHKFHKNWVSKVSVMVRGWGRVVVIAIGNRTRELLISEIQSTSEHAPALTLPTLLYLLYFFWLKLSPQPTVLLFLLLW